MDISGDMTCPFCGYTGAQYIEEEEGERTEFCDLCGYYSFESKDENTEEYGPSNEEPTTKVVETIHYLLPWIDAAWEVEGYFPGIVYETWLDGTLPNKMEKRGIAAFWDALFAWNGKA